ncbi:MAG TPA: hypothetical protein PKD20_04750 [Candidatus Saccharibacteria bacterium]|jgi:hypothetical protein|nr:hypothetical protein [Candidatus Saccharibacteria bacterium]HMT56154.1 hypothetical protein [Candidatus Saccharibacteria bacterium]
MYYTLTPDKLSFILEGPEQIAALRAKVSVERSDIISIKFHEVFSDWSRMMVRMPGSYLPRWIMAGSYWSDEGWDFVYAHKPRGLRAPMLHNVLVITTKKDKFRRLIIETKRDNAREIEHWLSMKTSKGE